MAKKSYCCKMMTENAKFSCKDCHDEFECPDSIVYHNEKEGTFGIIIHDGGSSYIQISYCPWCGKKL